MLLTVSLDSQMHLGLCRVWNCVAAKLNYRTGDKVLVSTTTRLIRAQICYGRLTYFFMITCRRAFPRVWSSFRNSKEAAVSVEPGSYALVRFM